MTLLEQIAQQRTNDVVYHAVSVTIEKIAEEAAREMLQDPAFRAELKLAARQSMARAARDLRREGPARRKRPAAKKGRS